MRTNFLPQPPIHHLARQTRRQAEICPPFVCTVWVCQCVPRESGSSLHSKYFELTSLRFISLQTESSRRMPTSISRLRTHFREVNERLHILATTLRGKPRYDDGLVCKMCYRNMRENFCVQETCYTMLPLLMFVVLFILFSTTRNVPDWGTGRWSCNRQSFNEQVEYLHTYTHTHAAEGTAWVVSSRAGLERITLGCRGNRTICY